MDSSAARSGIELAVREREREREREKPELLVINEIINVLGNAPVNMELSRTGFAF